MFSKIAPRYDLLNHVLSLNVDRLWRKELIKLAGVAPGGSVLDACTGTGDVAIGFAKAMRSGRVVGLDRSDGMLEIGKKKVRSHGLNGLLTLVESDVLDLPFEDGTFDAVSIAFGLRNLPDYHRGISEMRRVLRNDGKLLVLEFSPPSGGLYLRAYRFYLRNVLPLVGGAVSGSRDAYRYLASSIGEFLSAEQTMQMMRDSGLSNVRAHRVTGGIAHIYYGER